MKKTLFSSLLIGTLLTSTISVKAVDLSHVIPGAFASGSGLRMLYKITQPQHSLWTNIASNKMARAQSTFLTASGFYSLHKGLVANQESSQQCSASYIFPGVIRLVVGVLLLCGENEMENKEGIFHICSLIGSGCYSLYKGLIANRSSAQQDTTKGPLLQ